MNTEAEFLEYSHRSAIFFNGSGLNSQEAYFVESVIDYRAGSLGGESVIPLARDDRITEGSQIQGSPKHDEANI